MVFMFYKWILPVCKKQGTHRFRFPGGPAFPVFAVFQMTTESVAFFIFYLPVLKTAAV